MGNNFMIGMVYSYDFARFQMEFKHDFFGIEACMLSTEEDIENLRDEAINKNFKYGIHYPLRRGLTVVRDALFLSLDDEVKRNAYELIENELKYIKQKGLTPIYVLFHYPKPVVLRDDFDLTNWRFDDRSEYIFESQYPEDLFVKNTEELFEWLSKKGKEYNFTPVLEFDGLNKYVIESDFLEKLLEKYQDIKMCLDISRLHFQHKVQKDFDETDIMRRFAKYSYILHLSNVCCANEEVGISHYPALEDLREEDGWAPIPKYLRIIRHQNPDVKIFFEHRSYLINNEQLNSCYNWIDRVWFKKRRSDKAY